MQLANMTLILSVCKIHCRCVLSGVKLSKEEIAVCVCVLSQSVCVCVVASPGEMALSQKHRKLQGGLGGGVLLQRIVRTSVSKCVFVCCCSHACILTPASVYI